MLWLGWAGMYLKILCMRKKINVNKLKIEDVYDFLGRLWCVVELRPNLVFRDPYGERKDLILPPNIFEVSPDFAANFKFCWRYDATKHRELTKGGLT